MADKLEKLIERLSFRIRLFIETTGSGISDEKISERDLTFLEYLEEKGATGFSELSAFFKKMGETIGESIQLVVGDSTPHIIDGGSGRYPAGGFTK